MRVVKRLLVVWLSLWGSAVVTALVLKRTARPLTDPTAPSFALYSIFDGTEFRPSTDRLADSSALTFFGGTQIDLRRAAAAAQPVRLRLTTVMGGTDVTVPDTWKVVVVGTPVAGGHEISVTDHDLVAAEATELLIEARTVMGGLRVIARPVLATAHDDRKTPSEHEANPAD